MQHCASPTLAQPPPSPATNLVLFAPSRVAQVRKPVPSHELYVVNQDYGYHSGWAVGSLAMAEKVLQAELGLPAPRWLDAEWYEKRVVAEP